jgi:NADH oxidase (H2O2-forming)|tara:strand:+ start:3800 stop:5146 length:1347 start_codon:yes stop_codon:yes gene_type:complete
VSKKVVIIGNGISGITAAREIRKKSGYEITVISAESQYFFSRTALMYVFMGHMRFEDIQPYENNFWEKNRIKLVFNKVDSIDSTLKTINLQSGDKVAFDDLIIATGSKSNVFDWPGTQYKGVQGLYSKQDLESLEDRSYKIKKAVIIGGGLIGIELAEMLLSRNIEVHFLVRETKFWNAILPDSDADFVGEHIKLHHGLHMHYEDELVEILGDENEEVKGITTKKGKKLDVQFVGLAVGVSPNISFLDGSSIETDRGILVDANLETSVKNIYAIGDCVQMRQAIGKRRPIEQVWYTGRMMGETVAETICGKPTAYRPGNWFNSAKFFDLEYQTYGWVFAKRDESESEFIWEDPKSERMLHFVFDKKTKVLIGVNCFGIRLRHELLDVWLTEKKDIAFVLQNFTSANFDPEFFKPFEQNLIDSFNKEFKKNIALLPKKWWQKLLTNNEK